MSGYDLRRFRLAHDLTRLQLAQMLDVHLYAITDWEAPPGSQRYQPISASVRRLILQQLARHRYEKGRQRWLAKALTHCDRHPEPTAPTLAS